ncbi:sodium- and chloride-dependent betaine transporter-like [Mizuhopecten yessoensis]|uniref:sodium- and chloride-dependent betaine transporter-like n=1 Tax=Mizuhopecten yessoensis TaxID=6573 RepID=UPI000B45BE86|nr:sodium- and chloride-dependent betaine transporter-like [Mizuhopecten yessoensis]
MSEENPCDADSRTEGRHVKPNQGIWKNKVEYILSLAGYTTGTSDFWRFPYLIWRHGGGTFIFAYVISAVIIAIPVYYLEVAVSQFSGRGMFDVWDISPIMKGLGIGMFLINLEYVISAPTFRLWIMQYIGYSCMSPLPWKRCDNPWNTPACVDFYNTPSETVNSTLNISQASTSEYNMSATVPKMQVLAEEEFFLHKIPQISGSVYELGTLRWDLCLCLLVVSVMMSLLHNILQISGSVYELGTLRWDLCLCLLVFTSVCTACVIKSEKSIGKAMYVLTFLPLVLLVIIWIRTLVSPGAVAGMKYFLTPNLRKFGELELWVQAGFSAVFSLGTAHGGVMELGSGASFRTSVLSASVIPCVIDIFGSIFTSMVVYSVIGVMAHESGMQLGETLFSGNSAAFVAFSRAFSFFPLPNLWLVLFFLAFLVATSDIIIIFYEILNRCLQNFVPGLRDRPKTSFAAMFVISFLANLPFCTQAGPYFFQITGWYIASWGVFLMATLECVTFMWIYGGHMLDENIKMMNGTKMPHIIRFTAAFVCPVLFIVILVIGMARYKPPVFGTYHYPSFVEGIGILISILPLIPVVYWIMLCLYRNRGAGFQKEGLNKLIRPGVLWGPRDLDVIGDFQEVAAKQKSWSQTAYYNLTGRHREITRSETCDQPYVMTKMI